MDITFSNATIEHLPTIVEIYNSTVASGMVTADTQPVSVESKLDWFHQHTPDKRPLQIIQDSAGYIIGWVSFQSFYGRPAYNATAEISIYLHEKVRGLGVGKKALQHCISVAPTIGITTLLGFIFKHNLPSITLFTSAGFEVWGDLPNVAIINENPISLLITGLQIGPK